MTSLNPNLRGQSSFARHATGRNEIGWWGKGARQGHRFTGGPQSVNVKYDPTELDPTESPDPSDPHRAKDNFIYHTHPNEAPSPLSALPSEQDLIAAMMGDESGLTGSTVFSGDFYTVVIPTDKVHASSFSDYTQAVKDGDFDKAIQLLRSYGFEVETGQLD